MNHLSWLENMGIEIVFCRREGLPERADVMAFGAHPDDVEIGCGGLLARAAGDGRKVLIVDLTRGEQGSRGTPEERKKEAAEAAAVLGAEGRLNLCLPDRGIDNREKYLAKVVAVIRLFRPRLVLLPPWQDRHPDHEKASRLVQEAVFAAGLRKMLPELNPYRPEQVLYYYLGSTPFLPHIIVDVSNHHEIKERAIAAHRSQFGDGGWEAIVSQGGYPYLLDSRDRFFGALIGGRYGEGYMSRGPLPLPDPLSSLGKFLL